MKTEIKLTTQSKNHPPTLVFNCTTSHPLAAAHALETTQKYIANLVDQSGSKMPLIKLEITVGKAPASMQIFRSSEHSNTRYDVFLFGNKNILYPERTRTSSSFKRNNQPKFAEKINPTPVPIQIPY